MQKIGSHYLDKQQESIVLDDSKHLLVVAGAGSGKTLTILGKINYLLKSKNIKPEEILCISFTKASCESLKEKIKKEFDILIPVYTFHKLSLEILKKDNYTVTDPNTLDNIIYDFFEIDILNYKKHMKLVLKYFGLKKIKNIKKQYQNFYNNNEKIKTLQRLISTFLHLFKCQNYKLEDFIIFLRKSKHTINYSRYKKEKIFLILALNIYLKYMNYLDKNNEIDFDDMIINACEKVKKEGINQKYKYIIIDEYQDTSYVRFCLIKEILNKTNANLMVVGDDFQSIYRFTGCDLSLFLNFKKYFKDSKIMKIENTYRNSKELITIAGNFVMKNKKQIKKQLKANKSLENPIKIIYYKSIKQEFKKLINNIYNNNKSSILILGRNNKDINMVIDNQFELKINGELIYLKNPKIKLRYLTVHKSKGLEEENVIIINLINNILGFPNQLKDDKVLRFVSNSFEKYPYSEERRLFYVALTRTKNYSYLLVPYKNESIFIKEIIKLSSK